MPETVFFTSTSPGPSWRSGTSRTSSVPGATRTAARMSHLQRVESFTSRWAILSSLASLALAASVLIPLWQVPLFAFVDGIEDALVEEALWVGSAGASQGAVRSPVLVDSRYAIPILVLVIDNLA